MNNQSGDQVSDQDPRSFFIHKGDILDEAVVFTDNIASPSGKYKTGGF